MNSYLLNEIPLLDVAATFTKGKTATRDATELRGKESDLTCTMAQDLRWLRVQVTELPDGLEIASGHSLRDPLVDTHYDQRVAISLAIAAILLKIQR